MADSTRAARSNAAAIAPETGRRSADVFQPPRA